MFEGKKKRGEDKVAAGVFTQPNSVSYVLDALETGVERGVIKQEDVSLDVLEGFLAGWGRKFYGIQDVKKERVVLRRGKGQVVDVLKKDGVGVEVVPFRRGEKTWSVEWR